jgi:CTP:molybdopterin cytidylyltransferase MocA
MGAPKLLLPLGGRPVIDHVLDAWTASSVTHTIVVVRRDDAHLIERCRQYCVDLVLPHQPPADMKASVALALTYIAQDYAPANNDAWLIAPADLPRLGPRVIDAVLGAYDPARPTAVAPVHRGLRGHPTLLPWSVAAGVRGLAADEGVNSLVALTDVREVACGFPGMLDDLDDPAEYARLADRWPAPTANDETGP